MTIKKIHFYTAWGRYIKGHGFEYTWDYDYIIPDGEDAPNITTLGNMRLCTITPYSDSVHILLSSKPARIDYSLDTLYVLSDDILEGFPEPYTSLKEYPGIFIYIDGERELADIEECGDLVNATRG